MKTFVCTLAALIIITGGVVLNSLYISDFTDEMTSIAESLPDEPSDKSASLACELRKKLEENENILLMTVNHNEIELIDLRITEIITRCETGDRENYSFAVKAFLTEIEELKKSEAVSWESII